MTPKQIALYQVAKIISLSVIVGLSCGFLFSYFSFKEMAVGLTVFVLIFLIKLVYDIELSRAETLAKLNKTSQN